MTTTFVFSGPRYAARYLVPFATAFESATGSDSGLLSGAGLAWTAQYQVQMMGGSSNYHYGYFNWGDCSEQQEVLAELMVVAARTGDGSAAWTLRDRLDKNPPTLDQIDNGDVQVGGPFFGGGQGFRVMCAATYRWEARGLQAHGWSGPPWFCVCVEGGGAGVDPG